MKIAMNVYSLLLVVLVLASHLTSQGQVIPRADAPNYSFAAVTPESMEWNGLTWGMTRAQVESRLAHLHGVESHKMPESKRDIRGHVTWSARIHGANLTVLLWFYGPADTLQAIDVVGNAPGWQHTVAGGGRDTRKEELFAAARRIVSELDVHMKRDGREVFGEHVDSGGVGSFSAKWVAKHTVAEVSHVVRSPQAKPDIAVEFKLRLWSRSRAEVEGVPLPKSLMSGSQANESIFIPAGARSKARLYKGPDERLKGAEWDAIVITNGAFVDSRGESRGPDNVRILVKIDGRLGVATAFKADWPRPEADGGIAAVMMGHCVGIVGLAVESDGSLMRSRNESVEVLLTADLELRPWDARAEVLKSLLIKAEAGDVEAMELLAGFYLFGLSGCQQDKSMAMDWYSKAARAGSDVAMFALAGIYSDDGDWEVAKMWYERAAELGNIGAHRRLAGYYASGVHRDARRMLAHTQEAAKRGDSKSMVFLASRYRDGDGVPKDMVACYAWVITAAVASPEDSKLGELRDIVEKMMEPHDKRIAEDLSRHIRVMLSEQSRVRKSIADERWPARAFGR